jgi:hypothetical protein
VILRRLCVALVVAIGVLSACGTDNVAQSNSTSATSSSPDAATLLETARDKYLTSHVWGYFEQKAQFGEEATGMTVSSVISYDTRINNWRTRQTYKQAAKPEVMSEFLVTPRSVFLTMDGWPEKLHGRWLRYSIDQLEAAEQQQQSGGESLGLDLAELADPPGIQVLKSAVARSTNEDGGYSFVEVDLPADEALSLVNLNAGLLKANIDPKTLEGVVPAFVMLSGTGELYSLSIRPGSFGGVEGLPAQIAQTADLATVDVEFDVNGFYEQPTKPSGDDIIDPDEMNP